MYWLVGISNKPVCMAPCGQKCSPHTQCYTEDSEPMFCFSIYNNNAQTTVHQEEHRNKCFELFTGRKYTPPNDTHPHHKQKYIRLACQHLWIFTKTSLLRQAFNVVSDTERKQLLPGCFPFLTPSSLIPSSSPFFGSGGRFGEKLNSIKREGEKGWCGEQRWKVTNERFPSQAHKSLYAGRGSMRAPSKSQTFFPLHSQC